MALKRWDLVQKKTGWVTKTKSGKVKVRAKTKAEAVRKTARLAKRRTHGVSVRIHNRNGDIQEERTYPRSANPKSSKG